MTVFMTMYTCTEVVPTFARPLKDVALGGQSTSPHRSSRPATNSLRQMRCSFRPAPGGAKQRPENSQQHCPPTPPSTTSFPGTACRYTELCPSHTQSKRPHAEFGALLATLPSTLPSSILPTTSLPCYQTRPASALLYQTRSVAAQLNQNRPITTLLDLNHHSTSLPELAHQSTAQPDLARLSTALPDPAHLNSAQLNPAPTTTLGSGKTLLRVVHHMMQSTPCIIHIISPHMLRVWSFASHTALHTLPPQPPSQTSFGYPPYSHALDRPGTLLPHMAAPTLQQEAHQGLLCTPRTEHQQPLRSPAAAPLL